MASFGWAEVLVILVILLVLIVPLVIVAVAVLASRGRKAVPVARKPCPYCAELIRAEAKVCRFCGRELPASE